MKIKKERTVDFIIKEFVKSLDDEHFKDAIADFLAEQELVGKFAVWSEKWKMIHRS